MMDYQNAYSDQAGDYGMPDMSNGTPNTGAYQDANGVWHDAQGRVIADPNGPNAGMTLGPLPPGATALPGGLPKGPGQTAQDTPPPPPPGTTTTDSGLLTPFSEPAPTFPGMTPFSFDAFKPPTMDEALNDPGAKARWQRGMDSLQNWAAARGTLNDSDTGKMLIDYGQNSEAQDYGNVYARNFGTWQGNEQAAERQYGLNRTTQSIDPWTAAFNAWVQRNNSYNQNQGVTAQSFLSLGNAL